MHVVLFNFNNYFDNPIVKYCLDHNLKQLSNYDLEILTMDDALKIIKENNLKHSLRAYNEKKMPFISDQLRLYLSTLYNDFLYLDADVYVNNIQELLQYDNCTEMINTSIGYAINNGTFFHSNRDCRFNNYYLDIYDKHNEITNTVNYCVFNNFPFEQDYGHRISGDMHLINPNVYHFILSRFTRVDKGETNIDYTLDPNFNPKGYHGVVWQLKGCVKYRECEIRRYGKIYSYDIEYDPIGCDKMLELWMEQMEYSVGHTLKFHCIDK